MKKKFIVSPIDENIVRDKIIEAALNYDIKASNLFSFNYASIVAEEEKTLLAALPDIEVIFTLEAYTKMRYIIQNFQKEVAWHGIVTREGQKLVISEIIMPPQVITSATVDADEEQYGPWLLSQGERLNDIRMQGHSHVSMSTGPSGPDESYMRTMLTQINNFYIFIIANKRDEFYIRVYDKTNNVEYTELQPNIRLANGLNMNTWFTNESAHVREHVYKSTYVPPEPPFPGYNVPRTPSTKEKGDRYDEYVKELNLDGREDRLSLLTASEDDKKSYEKIKKQVGRY